MAICLSCGGADYLRCNCSIEPYCDQCNENDACNSEMDTACVIYHPTYPGQTPLPSQLTTLALPNGSSAQTIFEAIDYFLGHNANTPIVPVDSPTLHLAVSGFADHTLTGNVKIATDSGNIISAHSTGIYATNTYQVKVNATTAPHYLDEVLFGGTDGCVSITVTEAAGLLNIQPTLDLECFATRMCAADGAIKAQLGECLIGAGLGILDTPSIDLSLVSNGTQLVLSANAKISAASGNSISINSDGLFSSGGVNAADNGLSINSSTVQLGGPLIKNTGISFANTYILSLTDTPRLYLGQGTLGSNALMQIDNTYKSSGITIGHLVTTTGAFDNAGLIGVNGNVIVTGGTDTDHSVKAGLYGQIFFNSGTAATLSSFPETAYTGTAGLVTMYGTGGSIVGTEVVSGISGVSFAADNVTVTKLAALLAKGMYQAPQGAAWTGTATNYYGLYIEDANNTFGSHITNKYAIFQEGTTSLNVFSTAATVSDVRKKENIVGYTKGLAEIDQLRTVEYNFIADVDKTKKIGVIAQEVEVILPEAIHTRPIDDLDDFKLVESDVIFYTMLNAIKDLSAQNKALSDRLLALEGKLK